MARARKPKSGSRKKVPADLVKMAVLAKRSGVPTPTIKHYIREGLLPGPVIRTSKNMAYYDARVVDRIKMIKALQADQYLPLRVIGEILEPAPGAALRADPRAQRKALIALAPAVTADRSVHRRRRTDVLKTSGITRHDLMQLEKSRVIELQGDGDTAGYSGPDLDIVELVAEIRRLGYGELFPISIGPAYLAAVRKLLDFEIELFRAHVFRRTLPAPLPEIARHAVQFGARLIMAIRAKLLPITLAQIANMK